MPHMYYANKYRNFMARSSNLIQQDQILQTNYQCLQINLQTNYQCLQINLNTAAK